MNPFRHIARFLLVLLLFAFVIPLPIYANGPAPAPWFTFELKNRPEGAVYMDLLIRMEETDPHYSQLEQENLLYSFGESAEIVNFSQDGFRSYTFHYAGAKSKIRLNSDNKVTFFVDGSRIYSADTESTALQHKEDIEKRGKVRLALLDARGNILQISDIHSLSPKGLFSYSTGSFCYDAARDVLEIETRSNLASIVIFLLIGLGGMAATCLTEWLVALSFDGIRDYSRLTVATNVVSQISMRIGQMLLYRLLFVFKVVAAYLAIVAVLEVLVYTCEFLFYSRKMKTVSWKRCLLYTICANTASLLAGFLLLLILIF